MRHTRIPARLGLLTMLALFAFFAGCARSNVPVPGKPVAYFQEKSQAADHWRDIAVDVADKIRDALVERDDLVTKPVFVTPPNSRPFMLAFHQLLKTELVSRGVQVSERLEAESSRLEYGVLTVLHDSSRFGDGIYSRLADFGIGLNRMFSGSSVSDHEIVVSVRMAYDNRYVAHLSYIRYINDADWPLYLDAASVDPGAGGNRTIRVTNN